MTITSITSVLGNKVQNININETETQFTVKFNLINKINKMNKIGRDLRNQFPNNEIGWGGDWIIIMK